MKGWRRGRWRVTENVSKTKINENQKQKINYTLVHVNHQGIFKMREGC